MREQDPMTQVMKATQARQEWSTLLNKVYRGTTRVIVEKSGIPVAAIISPQDLALLERVRAERQERFQVLERTGAAFKDVPVGEQEQAVGRALERVRAKRNRTGSGDPSAA
jgi:prevent-host-death family protein